MNNVLLNQGSKQYFTVGHRHSVPSAMPTDSHYEEYIYQILTALDGEQQISQRSLSRRMGIALGLTNLLVRRLVRKGFMRMVGIKPRRVRYLLTPTGIAEKARMSQVAFHHAVQRYGVARARVENAFRRLSADWPKTVGPKRIIFYGTGEVAEIGYICLQDVDLDLVGVIDDSGRERFFNVPLHSPGQMCEAVLRQDSSVHLIVMTLEPTDPIKAELDHLGVPRGRVIWI